MDSPPKLWVIFVTYVLAAVGIVVASLLAALVLHLVRPDVPDAEVLSGLPGLLAGGLASSTALGLTVLIAASELSPARLRLVPGRETGTTLAVMIVGVLSLGEALDSLVAVTGLAHRGSMEAIRRALVDASGPELFFSVVVIAFLAGSAEEVFFRGYMQSQLRAHWRPSVAIVVTSACFGLLHADGIHTPLAFALGLYLGFVTELAGSALPAIACHVVNNAVFTVLTAAGGSLAGFWPNLAMLGFTTMLFVACVVWLTRTVPYDEGR
jgi:membrane protease YdiL (CAAX protease family)